MFSCRSRDTDHDGVWEELTPQPCACTPLVSNVSQSVPGQARPTAGPGPGELREFVEGTRPCQKVLEVLVSRFWSCPAGYHGERCAVHYRASLSFTPFEFREVFRCRKVFSTFADELTRALTEGRSINEFSIDRPGQQALTLGKVLLVQAVVQHWRVSASGSVAGALVRPSKER
jgi:hypothetical protein